MAIYTEARSQGNGVHVDHILPVAHGGLTVPWNLQMLSSKENIQKSDKVDFADSRIVDILERDIAFLRRMPSDMSDEVRRMKHEQIA